MSAEIADVGVDPGAYLAPENVLALLDAVIPDGFVRLLVIVADVCHVIFSDGRWEYALFPVGLPQIGHFAIDHVQVVLFQFGCEQLCGESRHENCLWRKFIEAIQCGI